jgi:hypothetical protein
MFNVQTIQINSFPPYLLKKKWIPACARRVYVVLCVFKYHMKPRCNYAKPYFKSLKPKTSLSVIKNLGCTPKKIHRISTTKNKWLRLRKWNNHCLFWKPYGTDKHGQAKRKALLTFRNPAAYIKNGHTATFNTTHFLYFFQQIHVLNFLNMLHTLHFLLLKMPFIS